MLLTWHNLFYFQELMRLMRDAIDVDNFADFEARFHAERALGDVEPI
jgi:queuine tRNA-ribosyltransferase